MTRRGQNFSIATGQTNFTFENLNSTNWYLAEYKYHRSVPFSFWDIERFAIEPNKTEENHGPVQLFFGYQIVGNKTKLGNGIKRFPKAKFVLNPEFKALNSVGIDSEPFCNSTDQHFWLTQDHPERELNSADLISAICTKNSHHPMCNHTTHKLKLSTCHTTKYCYRANLVLSDRVYQMKRHCVDIADQFTNAQ
uniref:Uncharacterized protein n=1 Tax=Acrobeloides nanus TaxID=290746 RepID=A0A914EDF3_9BILA